MITELLGLAGSGILGSLFGMVHDAIQGKREYKITRLKLRLKENDQIQNHVGGFATSSAYSTAFLIITATYCACTIICFIWPDVTILTFNPDDEPRKFSFIWGLISFQIQHTKIYSISTGGVGFSLLHPIAFQIGAVITGINPTKSN